MTIQEAKEKRCPFYMNNKCVKNYPIKEELVITPAMVDLLRGVLKMIPAGDTCIQLGQCSFLSYRNAGYYYCDLFCHSVNDNIKLNQCKELKLVKS